MMRKMGWSRIAMVAVCALMVTAPTVQAQHAEDVTGTWTLALDGPFAAQAWALVIGQEGGALTATLDLGPMGDAVLEEVLLEDGLVSGEFTGDFHGQVMTVFVSAVMEGEECVGEITGFPMGDVGFTGTRTPG